MCVGGRCNYLDSGDMVLRRALLAAVAAGGGRYLCPSVHYHLHACIMIMGAHATDNCIIAVYGGLMSRRNFHISGAAIGSGVRLCGLWGPFLWWWDHYFNRRSSRSHHRPGTS
jgi:hypothetical protein